MWSQRQRKTSAWVHLITERETFLRICNTYKGNVLLAKGNRLTVITAACKKKKEKKKRKFALIWTRVWKLSVVTKVQTFLDCKDYAYTGLNNELPSAFSNRTMKQTSAVSSYCFGAGFPFFFYVYTIDDTSTTVSWVVFVVFFGREKTVP